MSERFIPRLRIAPVSIIILAKESDDALLLAADRQFTSDGIKSNSLKLRKVPGQQIVWSSSGSSSIGLTDFGNWINTQTFDGKNWGLFYPKAMDKLNKLNSKQRKSTESARASALFKDEDITAEILIAGWLEDKMGAYELTRGGQAIYISGQYFNAMGDGRRDAYVAREALIRGKGNLDCLTILKIVMESVASHVDSCNNPIDIWRITKDSVEGIMGEKPPEEKPISREQFHKILDKASKPIKKSEKEKS
ncbi:hypothetical protein ACFLUQ_00750 [Chloroflexota bacterium]